MIKDLIRGNRFAPRFGVDGPVIPMIKVDVRPGTPWPGPGIVYIELALSEQATGIIRDPRTQVFVVGLFSDDPSAPDVLLAMHGVCPIQSKVNLSVMDANSPDVMKIGAELSYTQLDIIFGPTALDLMSIALGRGGAGQDDL
jgi:hypothetical protein